MSVEIQSCNLEPVEMSTFSFCHAAVYQHVTVWIERVQAAIEDIRKILLEYDRRFQTIEKASERLDGPIQRATATLGDLRKTLTSFEDSASEIPVRALSATLAPVSVAFVHLIEAVHKYDDQFRLSTKLTSAISGPKDQAITAITAIASYSADAAATANAHLQGVTDGLRENLTNAAATAVDSAMPAAVLFDDKLHVSEKASAAGSAMMQKAKTLNEKLGLSLYFGSVVVHANNLDHKVTGGKVAPAIIAAYNAGLRAVGYVQERFTDQQRHVAENYYTTHLGACA